MASFRFYCGTKLVLWPRRLLSGRLFLGLLLAFCFITASESKEVDLFSLSLSELLSMRINSASNIEQDLQDAPASMVVITAQEIDQRGYTYMGDVMQDLPGFDFIFHGSPQDQINYQRGYRTSSTRLTLLLIDGVEDNDLWSRGARLSHQYPLSNVERIEVLYGPSSAVYGPNAFMGIINIVTKNGNALSEGEHVSEVTQEFGSHQAKGTEFSARGHEAQFNYSVSGKYYATQGPDLADDWGFLNDNRFANEQTWGPLLTLKNNGRRLGSYYSPSQYLGLLAKGQYKSLDLGLIYWQADGGYGNYYAGDWAQNNANWLNASKQIYARYHSKISPAVSSKTLLLYRQNRTWGDWIEAFPDWQEVQGHLSYISQTQWNSNSSSVLFKQDFEWRYQQNTQLLSGIKMQYKDLTKAFDVPGYYGAYSSTVSNTDIGPYGLGAAVGHSSDDSYQSVAAPLSSMPSDNRVQTKDYGVYVEAVHSIQQWRFNAGVRADHNSVYSHSINPRVASIYHFENNTTMKLVYGEAFQEPAPSQLFGGWNGSFANEDLKPEEAKSLEYIVLWLAPHWLHEISVYHSEYTNVIKEEAENAGRRTVTGFEYRGRFNFENFFPAQNIDGFVYYTFTQARSAITYDQDAKQWVARESDLGDIAPHKILFGINCPISHGVSINVRGRIISDRTLYSRNPLRAQGKDLDGYQVVDTSLLFDKDDYHLTVAIKNILDAKYFHPGAEQADSGDDFSQRSAGFRNSLLPQPGRSFNVILSLNFL